jgi:hypothetical protein
MRSGLSGRLASSIFSSRRASIAMPAAWRYLPENKTAAEVSGRTLSGGGLSGTGSSLAGLRIGQPRDTWHATDRGAAGSATRQRRTAEAAHFRQSAQASALACCAAARTLRVLNVRRC